MEERRQDREAVWVLRSFSFVYGGGRGEERGEREDERERRVWKFRKMVFLSSFLFLLSLYLRLETDSLCFFFRLFRLFA